jgi:hypothetical protein
VSLLARRVRRLAARGSVRWAVDAARREIGHRRDQVWLERTLRSRAPLLVGPFVGEVGYELLYWRPFVRRLLRTRRVDPERVTVVTRGGAGAWYADVAARSLDVFELMPPSRVRDRVEESVAAVGQRKQLVEDALDRELIAAAIARAGAARVVHPRFMYAQLRFLWDEGMRPAADALALGDHDPLPRLDLPAAIEARLPDRFVAAKVYFNEALTPASEVLAQLVQVLASVAADLPVVLLEAGTSVDDHADWGAAGIDVVRVGDLIDPASNLAVQAEIVARAESLVATYGGFSYLGPLTGTPTLAVWDRREGNARHEQILRTVHPEAVFERLRLGGDSPAAPERFLHAGSSL